MAPGSQTAEEIGEQQSKIDSVYNMFLDWMPYATLALTSLLSPIVSDRPLEDRLTTLGLAAATALWVYLAYTRIPSKRDASAGRITVHVFVMIGLGAALMSRDTLYFIFIITAFFHAGLLKQRVAVILAIASASIVVNAAILEDGPDMESVSVYLIVVVIQTAAISSGYLLHAKLECLTAEREEAFRAKEAAMEENAGLHMQLLTQAREAGVLDERQRMARDIHDTVAQGLAGIIAQLHAAEETDDEEQRRRHVGSAVDLARDSLAEARRTVQAIGPPTLETSQLSEALADLSAKWSESNEVPVELVTSGDARPMHPEIEVTLLRIAQEALTNVAKHAKAARVGITLSYMEDELALDVRDDGLGFEPGRTKATERNGYGLSAMRQRVGRLAGRLSIESEPGRGTVVSASVPAVPQAVSGA